MYCYLTNILVAMNSTGITYRCVMLYSLRFYSEMGVTLDLETDTCVSHFHLVNQIVHYKNI